MIQLDELKARKRVLRRLGYATAADVIETKGRVACEIATADEVFENFLKFFLNFLKLFYRLCEYIYSQWAHELIFENFSFY